MPVSSNSTLMQNHVAGRPLPSQRALATVCAADLSPIVLALDDAGTLAVSVRSAQESTGWARIDLSRQLAGLGGLGGAPIVHCFAAAQDTDGTIWVVVAAADSKTQGSKVFLSRGLPNTGAAADWTAFADDLVPRSDGLPAGTLLTELVLGSGDDQRGAPHIVGIARLGGTMRAFQFNPDPTDTTWTCLPVILPQNATGCLAAVAGNLPGLGRGVYSLFTLQKLINLTFTTLPVMDGGVPITQSRQLPLPAGYTPTTVAALAALPVKNGQTELYLSGAGLHRYPVSGQGKSAPQPLQIGDAATYSSTAALVVTGDGASPSRIDVWALNNADLLVATTGILANGAYTWQRPLSLATEVTALAAYRTAGAAGAAGPAALALGRSDGSLALSTKDPATSLWLTQTISHQVTDTALALNTYTTRITVTDDDGVTLAGRPVLIQPSIDAPALVNGQYMALKAAVAKPATTDPAGVVTIVLETPDMTAPIFTVTIDDAPQTHDPAEQVKARLRALKSGDEIADATRSDGSRLFTTVDDATRQSCDAAANGISTLMEAHDSLAGVSAEPFLATRHDAHEPFQHLGRTVLHSTGARRAKGAFEPVHGPALLAAAPAATGFVDFIDSAGDVLKSAFTDAANAISHWVVQQTEDAWNFLIYLGDQVIGFVIEVAEQAIAAIDFVLEFTLGLSLEDLIDWLGFLFHWGDILTTHRVLAHIADLGLDAAVDRVEDLRDGLRTLFDDARAALVDDRLVIVKNAPVLTERARQAPDDQEPSSKSAQANWGHQQLSDNAGGAKPEPLTLTGIADLFATLTEAEVAVLRQAYDRFSAEIVDNFASMTWSQLIDVFLDIVDEALLNAVEAVAMTFLDALGALIATFRQIAAGRWDIPVLTWLYEHVICGGDGSKLTMLDVAALIAAVPITLTARAINGQTPLPGSVSSAVLQAKTWDALIQVLAGESGSARLLAAAATATKAAAEDDPSMASAATLVFDASLATFASTACGLGVEAMRGEDNQAERCLNWMKIAFDWMAWSYDFANMVTLAINEPNDSPRAKVDRSITCLQILFPIRDTFLACWKQYTGTDYGAKETLACAEVGFGIGMVMAVTWSLTEEVKETPPTTQTGAWTALVSMKFAQNFLQGMEYAFALTEDEPLLVPTLSVLKACAGLAAGILAKRYEISDIAA